jgi:hypothetical protein
MRPIALEISACDFAFAADHRLNAISRLAATLNSAAPFSMAAASSAASIVPSQTALLAILLTFQRIGSGGSSFVAMPQYQAQGEYLQEPRPSVEGHRERNRGRMRTRQPPPAKQTRAAAAAFLGAQCSAGSRELCY